MTSCAGPGGGMDSSAAMLSAVLRNAAPEPGSGAGFAVSGA